MRPANVAALFGRLAFAIGIALIAVGGYTVATNGEAPAAALPAGSPPVAPATVSPASGDSSSDFELTIPSPSFCGGTGVDGYRYSTFLVPASEDIATLTFNALGPSVGDTPFVTGTFEQQRQLNPSTVPAGLIAGLESTLTMTGYDTSFRPAAGTYKIGVACTLSQEVTEFWVETITLTDDASDTGAAGFVWSVGSPSAAPAAPTNVSATPGDGQLTVSFDAVTANPAVLDYTVTATSGAGDVTQTGSGSPIVVTGLTNGTSYSVTVTARNDEGSGPASASVDAAPGLPLPAAPTGVSVAEGDGELVVSFTPATDGGAADEFTVTATAGGNDVTATGSASPITVTGLTNGTEYTVVVVGSNAGGEGAASSSVSATPQAPANPPDAATIDTVTPGDGSATVAFTPAATGDAATSFEVTATGTVDGSTEEVTATGDSSPIVVEGLTNGVEYEFVVAASNSAGTGKDSESVFATPVPLPEPPTITSVVAGDGSATVNFTPGSGGAATEYTVTATDASAADNALAETRTATGTSSPITVTGLENGVTYDITISASNAAGSSAASTAQQVTPTNSGGSTTGGSTTGGSTTGGSTTGGSPTLVATGSNHGWTIMWAGVLLVLGRIVVLLGRTPQVIGPTDR